MVVSAWGISRIVSFDPAAVEKSTVEFEAKTDTLDTGSAQRNNDIKSPNFLNVKQGVVLQLWS